MTNTPRVVVLDGLVETETVLRAVLEPQGTRVERRRSSGSTFQDMPPEVVVVDMDELSTESLSQPRWLNVPRVVLSSVPLTESASHERFLEKPFHYPELVRAVQSLLELPAV